MQQDALFTESQTPEKSDGPVTCLGKTFANDTERRAYFTKQLAEKLKDPEFRKIEGFPIGTDEAILNLSDPPYYTACPNPFLRDFIEYFGKDYDSKDIYSRTPFVSDVSEGKSDSIYGAHTYHTKVPPKAIARYILHYTKPGDIILDGFSGTGMTGVAAQLCSDKKFIEELGYKVDKGGVVSRLVDDELGKGWEPFSALGSRIPLLNDLSPIATFVTNNYGNFHDFQDFCSEAIEVITKLESTIGWVYRNNNLQVLNGIWSDVFLCPFCGQEVVYWDAAVKDEQISKKFSCPNCGALVGKAASKSDGAVKLQRAFEQKYDSHLECLVNVPKLVLVEQTVKNGKNRERVRPNATEVNGLLEKIESKLAECKIPISKFEVGRQTNKLINGSGIHYVHQMYTPRALYVYSTLWGLELSNPKNTSLFRFCLTAINNYISRKQGYFGGGGGVAGTLFTPSIHLERNVFDVLKRKINGLLSVEGSASIKGCVSTQSSACLTNLSSDSIDYIFIDPPFGENFQYAELNSFAEAWLRVKTDTPKDCVMNYVHKKDLDFYMSVMKSVFKEFYRVLKPGRWISVEFSNTQASVWNVIQTGLQDAGFVVANVAALDKQQLSFNAVMNTTSVKKDLVISAYKPDLNFEIRFESEAKTEAGVWDFIRTHLQYLPVVKLQGDALLQIPERDPRILFDQVVAYYVRKGYHLPISSQEFQAGLAQRFVEDDGMYFLDEQAAEYRKKKAVVGELVQASLFVKDEASAIQWLRQLLKQKPQVFSDINPQFMQQLSGWSKNEVQLDLRELLSQNFLCSDGQDEVPEQIHSYLSTNWKELRNLPKTAPELKAKAKDRWYVPDPNKAGDLEKLRERSLLKEFEEYKTAKKKLKVLRIEAARVGFKKLFEAQEFASILDVAAKLPADVIAEDPVLLMYYDQAMMLTQTQSSEDW